jgi:putative Holliday junction resolvase
MNETLASIDIGLKRIGVALCVHDNIVTPQAAILRKNRNQAANEVDEFLKQWNIATLVVGFPSASIDMQNRIKHFVQLLEFEGKIVFQEENMSSIEAKSLMQGEMKQKRDGRIDSIAAQIILQRYLQNAKA